MTTSALHPAVLGVGESHDPVLSPPQPWGFSCLEKLCLRLVTCSCGCGHGWSLPALGHSPVPLDFVAPLVPALGPVTFDTPIIIFGTTDFFCVFFHTTLKSDIFPRSPGSCSFLETKIWSWVCTQLWALLRWQLTMCSHRGNCCHKHPPVFLLG